ncbi:MAG: tRNA (N(6)-L-threonylcarbamoyladenosine(37)-C(2))-methylthiotransferase MtaB [Coriobacteriaceae bacterium]|nr:tRNA (N(6)-L-threonylcarbamoyladenosine(37)-C(2))-methylthiotransferase MtaB [Coriobacteriaceae bacterium]
MRFFVHNLGCKVNRVESDRITADLISRGATSAPIQQARVVVINTCTVTAEADRKARKAVRQALTTGDDPVVIVTGCATVIAPEMFTSLGEKVLVIADKQAATQIAAKYLGCDDGICDTPRRTGAGFPTRMAVKIQDGCDNRCSYCIVATARGPARSVVATDILTEVKAAQESGVHEIVLTGINLGRYDDSGLNLSGLLDLLCRSTVGLRFRLSSIEPPDIDSDLIDQIATGGERICAHLHLPLQSGSDTILARMNRAYDSAFYQELTERLRSNLPRIALTTDVIVGFPGESEAEFEQSLQFCERIGFSKMHIFRYSPRAGTPAATMANQIEAAEKTRRAQMFNDLAIRMRQQDAIARIGTIETVLIEKRGFGMSESYHRVQVPIRSEAGDVLRMQFCAYNDNLMTGRVL